MTALPPVCLLAGGLGTRLGETVKATPKPLLDVAGEPFLVHQLRMLRAHGAERVVLCVGYLGELIEQRIGPEMFGIQIIYSYDGPALIGTLGAVRKAAPLLGERFLVLYGDTYLRIDYARVAAHWRASGAPALMTVLRNRGRWDTSNVLMRDDGTVLYDKRSPVPEMEWIDYGLGGLQASALGRVGPEVDDLADLYHALSVRGELVGSIATERFYEIGTPAALAETEQFLRRLGTEEPSVSCSDA
jgi:NDP-sugar pyrophosphorylase family protein